MATATVAAGTPRGQTTDGARRGADDILSLPFVRDLDRPRPETGTSRHFWTPGCEGLDFAAGCALGQDHAIKAVRFMAAQDCQPLLGWVALDLAASRPVEGERGVAVGFFGVFATLAMWSAAGAGMDRVERAFAERRARMAAFEAARARGGRATS